MDPFDVFGFSPSLELDADAVEARYRELQRFYHPDRYVRATPAERRLSMSKSVEVTEAYRVLRTELSRADALVARAGGADLEKGAWRNDASLLMTMMELREQISAAGTDPARLVPIDARVASELDAARALVRERFRAVPSEPGEARTTALHELVRAVDRLRYWSEARLTIEHARAGNTGPREH